MLDQVIWWTGALVLGGFAALAASALIFGLYALAFIVATHAVLKLGNIATNLTLMHAWKRHGCPDVHSTICPKPRSIGEQQ